MRSKAWLAARVSVRLVCMPHPGRRRLRIRLRRSFSCKHLVLAVWRTYRADGRDACNDACAISDFNDKGASDDDDDGSDEDEDESADSDDSSAKAKKRKSSSKSSKPKKAKKSKKSKGSDSDDE